MVVGIEREQKDTFGLTLSLSNLTLHYDDDLDSMYVLLSELKLMEKHFAKNRFYYYYFSNYLFSCCHVCVFLVNSDL